MTKRFSMTRHTREALYGHARKTFPDECCGVVLDTPRGEEVHPVTNIQDALHAADPRAHPRDATRAYFMDPARLLVILEMIAAGAATLRAFYHSHPGHPAYFSARDRAAAVVGDQPLYRDACYLVISVAAGQPDTIRAYAWDERGKDFAEVPIVP